MSHKVYFKVSAELISNALAMPEGSKIENIVKDDYSPDTFLFYVEHPDLPEVIVPLQITPRLTVYNDLRPDTWIEFDWNIPKGD